MAKINNLKLEIQRARYPIKLKEVKSFQFKTTWNYYWGDQTLMIFKYINIQSEDKLN